jgi:hypothetical protein
MIGAMLPRALLVTLLFACSSHSDVKEPRTAKEKQMREARASGELDTPNKKWGGWRYQGDRGDCFYVFGRRCYKTEEAACKAARCKAAAKCTTVGAGPATMTCK